MDRILLRRGRVIDPARGIDGVLDVLVGDGRVEAVGAGLEATGATVFEAAGMLVIPGLVDTHCHLRDPGFTAREDIASGTRSAAAGGFTSVACMPNTDPPLDSPAVVGYVLERARRDGVVRVYPVGALTRGRKGREVSPMEALARSGVVMFSDDGDGVQDAGVMRRCFLRAKEVGRPVAQHCEDATLSADGAAGAAEVVMVARDILLAEETGARLHICHVSRARSVELVREAKERGLRVTAEATFHHLTLTGAEVDPRDSAWKVNPPLGGEEDREALRQGVRDGTIDAICTDHAPHTPEDKAREFVAAPPGMIGLETALPVVLTELVEEGVLGLSAAIEKMTLGPARVLGIPAGTLAPGAPADIAVIDPTAEWTVDPGAFVSKARNSPHRGRRLRGRVVLTLVGGKVVVRDGKVVT